MRIEQFRKRLIDAIGEHAKDDTDFLFYWTGRTSEISNILDGLGSGMSLDEVVLGGDAFVQVAYWIPSIEHSIMLSWDAYAPVNTAEELADVLMPYEIEGKQLSKKIEFIE